MNEEHVFEGTADTPTAADDPAQTPPQGEADGAETENGGEAPEAAELSDDPDPHSDSDPGAADPPSGGNELDELRGELNRLKAELAARDARASRIDREYREFQALYPDVPLNALPDALWREVESGVPLAAAYALAERRNSLALAQAQQTNAENQSRSSGALHGASEDELSPAEVRAMSAADVRKNLSRIMRSMQKWH